MLKKEQAKKFLSIGTYNQLTKHLYKLEHVTSKRDILQTKEKIRDMMTRLFDYSDIVDLHDDHVLELAETIVGLYPERDNLEDYTYYILEYLQKQIWRYEETKQKWEQKKNWEAHNKNKNPDMFLDLTYITWTYTNGYYHQQANMYRLLRQTLIDLLEYDQGRVTCKKKKNI